MRDKADSIVIEYFGLPFFKNNIEWNSNGSYFYNDFESKNWKDAAIYQPKRFKFSYNIILDKDYKTPSIEFQLDSIGQLLYKLPRESFGESNVRGIKKCTDSTCEFKIGYHTALNLAASKGLNLNKKYDFNLDWIQPDNINSFIGEYLITIESTINEKIKGNLLSIKYEEYIINPWTGEFVSKKTKTSKQPYCGPIIR